MDRFRKSLSESLITRFISYCLITQLVFPPLWVNNVYAALVTDPHAAVSFRPQIDNTYNIPVINIVAPNNTGLSHNKYQDFDVDLNGLVFNNSLVTGNSRLAGSIVANPLFGGRTASIILNEVTGASDSELKGLMEVFGDKANVIIANPNGITCNGCGFINTQRGTLTTGTPDVSQGKLRFDVDGGLIRFEEEGHSYRSFIDEMDVLSQYIDVNGDISTKDRLSLVAGRFIFDYSKSMAGGSLTEWVEPKAYDAAKGSERALAVDGTIFGAMQSGQIDIMGTEQGLGVKADGYLFAQADDLFIQSAGGLSINNADAVREIKLSAEDDITIGADLIANLAISAKADAIETTAETNLIANKIDLNAEKNIHLNGEMKALELNVEAESIVSEADLLAINSLEVNAKKEAIFKNSAIAATKTDIKTIELEIRNASFNAPTLSIETEKTLIENATIEVNDLNFNLGEAITNKFKVFSEIATINYQNWNDNNSQWNIGKLALSGKKLTSQNGSWLFNDGSINATDLILKESTLFSYNANITAANLSSNNSAIYTEKLTLTISQALTSIGDRWRILPFSEQGEISDAGTLMLTAAASEFTGSVIQADNLLLNSGRSQFSKTDVFTNTIHIEGDELLTDTDSLWVANNSVNLSTTITDLNHAIKTSNIQLEATKADLSGRWLIAENSTINSATSLNIAGLELSADSLIMSFEDGVWDDLVIKSSASNITAKNTLRVSSGTIESGQLSVAADVLTLDEKTWIGANNTNITADRLNNSGTLLAADELQLNTREIINNGVVASFDKLNITSSEALNNHGKIISDQLVIDSARITNTNSISSENFELNYQSLENKDKAVIVSSNAMYTAKTNTANFANYGTQIASDSIQWLTEGASSGRYINAGLLTGSSLNFTGLNQVTNGVLIDGVMKGTMQAVASSEEEGAQGQLSIGTEAFTQLGTIEADDININRNSFHNEGKIFTEKLTATIKDEFKNSGILASHTIDLSAAELINSQGSTISTNDLNLNQINVNNAGKLIAANIALSGNETAASYFINTDSGLLIQNALKSDGDSPVALGSVSISGFNTFTNRGLIETDALLSIDNITAFNNDSNDLSNLDSAARIVSESGIKLSNIGSLKNSAILVSDAISIKSDNFNNSGILGAGEATIEVAQGDLINSGRIYQSDLHASDSIRKQTSTLENEFKIKANGLINNETSSIELAKGSIDLKEGNLINKGLIGEVEKVGTTTGLSIVNIKNLENHNDISISEDLLIANVGSINNIGEDSYIKANKIIGTGLVSVNNEGKLLANEMIQLESASITNADNANIFSKEIKINTTSFTNNSLVGSELAIEVYATTLINNALAEIYSNNDSINLTGTESVTNKGSILAKVNLSIESALLSNNGILNAQNKIDINQRSIGTIENNGYIFAETVHLGNETNRQIKISNTSASFENSKGEIVLGGIQSGIGGLEIITSELVNRGQLSSDNDLLINSEQSMTGSNALTGSLETKGRLTLNTSGLDVTSSAKIIALGDDNTIIIGNDFNNDGLVSLNNNSSISSGNLNNSGTLSGNALDINITDDFSNSMVTSQLYADNLNIVTNSLNNNGLIQANKALGISAATDAVNNNQILSLETLVINGGENSAADSLTNSGTISSKALSLAATTLTNNGDAIITAETADLTATTISNAGTLYQLESDTADAAFNISSQTLTNNDSNATIDIKNGLFNLNTLINQGLIRERQDSSLDTDLDSDQLRLTNVKTLNNSGELILYNDLILTDASLINSGENAYIRTNSLTTNKLTDFSNSGKIAAQNVLTLNSEKALTNQGELVANQFTANTQQDFTNQGLVQATTQLEINAQNISNEASAEISKIGTDTNLELSAIGRINNAGNIASKSGLNVSANDIINSQNISSSKTTTLHANSLNNTGLIYGTDLNIGSNEQFIRQTRDEVRPEADVGLELEVETGGLVAANTLTLYTNGLMNDVYRASTIHLESNADLTLAGDITAEKHINVITENLTLNKTGSIYIGDSESESLFSMTQALKNEGDISSKSTLLINATDISNIGEIKTSKQLAINANTINTTVNSLISAADTLHISGSGASNNDQATSLITNGDIISDKSLSIQTDLITNNGNLQSAGNLDITAQTLSNAKNIQSNKQLNIIANDITNQASAQLSSIESLIINGAVNNTADSLTNSGTISSKVLNLAATTLINNGDAIITAETADLTATTISNAGALYQLESDTTNATFNVTAQTLTNTGTNATVDVTNGLFNLNSLINQGLIRERQENAADSDQLLLTNIKTLNNSGELILYSDLALTDASLINSGNDAYIRANALTANNLTEFSNTGKIAAQHVLTLSRDQGLTNQGELVANQFTANTQQDFINQGLVQANAQLEISARNISNTSTAEISKLGSDSDLKLTATAQLNNAGNIASKGGLKISTDDLVNSKKISSSNTTELSTNTLNNTGLIYGNNLTVGSNSKYVTQTRSGLRTEAEANTGGLIAANTLILYTNGLMNDVYRASNINLASNADLTLAGKIEAGKKVDISAEDLTINKTGSIYIGDGENSNTFTIAQAFNNEGDIAAESTLIINATDLDNSGEIKTSKQLVVNTNSLSNAVDSLISAADALHISGSDVSSSDQAASMINNGDIVSDKTLSLQAELLTNNGNLQSAGNLGITAQTLSNAKNIQSNQQLNIIANDITNQASAQLSSIESLTINGADNSTSDTLTNSGTISSKVLNLKAATLTNNGDAIIAAGSADLIANTISNAGAVYQLESGTANAAFNVTAQTLTNTGTNAIVDVTNGLFNLNTLINQGLIRERQENASDSDQLLLTNIKTLNNSGELILYSDLALTDATLTNRGDDAYIRANALTANSLTEFSNTGKIAAQNVLSLSSAQGLTNQGELVANQFTASTQQDFINQGLVQANTQLTISANNISNVADAEISKLGTGSDLDLSATGQLNNAGNIASQGGLQISANDLVNNHNISASETATLSTNTLNNTGLIYGNNLIVGSSSQYVTQTRSGLRTEAEANAGGLIAANTLTLYTNGLMNDVYRASNINIGSNADLILAGKITAEKHLSLTAENLTVNNTAIVYTGNGQNTSTFSITQELKNEGDISSNSSLLINATGINNIGEIKTSKQLAIHANTINTAVDSLISAAYELQISGSDVSSSDQATSMINNGDIVSDRTLSLQAEQLTNNGNLQSAGNLGITAQTLSNAKNIQSNKQLNIIANDITNQALAQLSSIESLTINGGRNSSAATLENSGTISSKVLNLAASTLNNNTAAIIAAETANLTATTLNNAGTLYQLESNIANSAFNISAETLNNNTSNATIDIKNGLLNLNTLINQGLIRERQENALDSDQLLLTNVKTLNNSGELILYSDLALTDASLINNGDNAYIRTHSLTTENLSEFSNNGKIAAQNVLTLNSVKALSNQGKLIANQFTASTQQDFINQGLVQANTQLTISANNISNVADAEISKLGTGSDLDLSATGQLNNAGNIASKGGLKISANDLVNSHNISASETATLSTNTLNNTGLIYGNNLIVGSSSQYVTQTRSGLRTEAEANAGGLIAANTLTLYTKGLMNDVYRASNINLASNTDITLDGTIDASNKLDIKSETLVLNGDISIGNSTSTSTWNISGLFSNQGTVNTASNLVLNANTIKNNSVIKAKKDFTINSDDITNKSNSVLSSQGRLSISGTNESLIDRSLIFTNKGEVVADAGIDLSANRILNDGNINAAGDSQWYFNSFTNKEVKRTSVHGNWMLGSALDRIGNIDNSGKLYASSFDIKTNGFLNNNNSAQFVSYDGDLKYLGTTNSDIVNEGGLFVRGKVNMTGNSLTNTGNIEIFGQDIPNGLVVGNSIISLTENFQNGVSKGEIQNNGVFKSGSSIKINAGKLNNQSAINMDSLVNQYEGVYAYDFVHDGRGGKADKLKHFLSYQYGEYRENIHSTFDVVGDLTVDAISFNNIGSSINVEGTLNVTNTSLKNISKEDMGILVGLEWAKTTDNNGKKNAGWALERNYNSTNESTRNLAIKHILDRVAKKGNTYIWADAFQGGKDRYPVRITQKATAFNFVNPTGVSVIKAHAIVGDRNKNEIDKSEDTELEFEKKREDNGIATDVTVLDGNNSDRTSITNEYGAVDDSSGVDNINQPNGADLKSESLANQTVTSDYTANIKTNNGAVDGSSGVNNANQPKGADLISELIVAQSINTDDKTNTKSNTGATSGKGRYIKHSGPAGELLASETIADYASTIKDLTSAQDNTGATEGRDTIVNAGPETERKEQENLNIATGTAINTEDLDETSDHVKGSFINGADGLVIQVANRKPTASISLLSFIIPGLSFDALSAASVAGDKTPEEIAAQVALQAQLDLLESDKEKNSDTIKGQSNSYNTQAPSLFDLDEDILQRIIADTEYELSPEYIFDKVDPDKILDTEPKFFLDPYQEAQAVTQAALQQTGTAFFSPDWSTSADQRKGLYDNTLAYLGTQQDVTLGNALTPMQVKQLEQPMIWYVSMDIGGQSQLVPTVYLPEATLAQITTPSAGTIIADSMDIDVGEFKNTGDIKVANSARIRADVITNQRNVMTFGDSTNYGAIAGSGGNISAGNLALISRSDINNNGGSLSALNGLTLDAQKDINLNALELKQRSQQGKNITESTDYLLSQINAGGDATFKAGGDFNSQAAQAKIGGNGIFDATNINLLGVTERDYSKTVKKKKGTFSSSKKTIEQENLNFVGSDFQVGGSMVMNAENDITMVGANIDVGKSAAIKAGNDITLTAGISTDKYSKDKSGSGVATTSSQQKGHVKETATGTMIKTGESLQIDSDGGNVTILASELDAQQSLVLGDMKVKVDEDGNKMVDENGQYIAEDGNSINNLTIGTVELKDESWNVKSSGLKGPLKDLAAVAAFAISASPLGQMAMAAGLDTEIEVGKTSESRVESTTHATSTLTAGETLAIKTDGDFRLEGSEANAKSASIETRSTTITAVENTTTTTESESTHTVGATKATLKKDEVTVAGSTETKHSETTTTTDTELVKAGLNISGDLGMTSVENIDILASDVNVEGSAAVKAKTITVAGLAETTTTEHKEKTETTTTSVGVKNAYVDTAFAIQAVVDAGAAVDAAKSALDQAKRDVKNGTLQANAIGDYEANLVAATTQLGQATLSAAASAATAAGTTGTGGFYASGSAEKTIVEKTSTDTEERYIGSNFNVGGDASFDASDNIDIIGSSMDIAGGLALNAKDVTIKAGTEETTSTSSETTRIAGMTASYGSGGSEAFSGGVNASGSNTDADSYSKTHINSSIKSGSLTSTSENLTLSGANVEVAGGIDIDTGNLVIESLQDESSSSSKTEGYSASANIGGDKSISPGNFGANENSSNADSKWVNNQTTLIGGTSGEGEVNITADSTTLTGAVLASATRNEDGSLTDNGTLNLATDELIIEDLKDKDHSESKGFDVSTSVGYSSDDARTTNKDEGYLTGSTTVGLTSDGHKKEQTTLATLGGGSITKKDGSAHEEGLVESANSDLNNSQEITKDMKTGGLNATVTVDHRLLSENGLNDISNDFEDSYEHGEDIARAVDTVIESDDLGILNAGEGIHNNAMATQLKNDLIRNPENAHILAGLQSGNPEEYDAATQALGKLAQEKFGLEASEINLYDGDETTSGTLANNALGDVAGGVVIDESNSEYGNIFIDAGDGATKTDMANTLGHEVLETQALQGKDGGVFGANSEQTQEAMGTAFGEQFADRINQAAGGNLDSTGGATFSSDLKNSNSVASGTQSANNVGNATVDHRQLYVAEAKAIIDAAPAYAKDRNISEAEAKKELTQQALLQVDKEWSEQDHIEENPEARAALAEIAKDMGDVAESPLGRNLIDQLADTETSAAFQANDKETFDDTNINAREVPIIESGLLGEEGFLANYATENGKKSVDVGLVDGAGQAAENIADGIGNLVDRASDDLGGLVTDTATGLYEGAIETLSNPENLVLSDSKGTADDRQLVAELQGNTDAAKQEAADVFTEMVGDLAPLGIGKAVKEGVQTVGGEAVEQAVKKVPEITPEMKADPYHTDWQNYDGPTSVGAAVVNTDSTVNLNTPDSGTPDPRSEFTGPYSADQTREDLEAVYGAENVTSSTNPNNPFQSVNSLPDKNIEVRIGDDGGKAVRVTFDDPVTGESTSANIPYNDRGLPIFDDHSKFTTNIDNSKNYRNQFPQATRDLRDAIDSGGVDSNFFTPNQLNDIRSGSRKIEGFTWHHNADTGNMQLIPEDVHDAVKHVGEQALKEGR